MRRTGLEPAHLAASAPQADVSTIPPPPQLKWIVSDNQKKVNSKIRLILFYIHGFSVSVDSSSVFLVLVAPSPPAGGSIKIEGSISIGAVSIFISSSP